MQVLTSHPTLRVVTTPTQVATPPSTPANVITPQSTPRQVAKPPSTPANVITPQSTPAKVAMPLLTPAESKVGSAPRKSSISPACTLDDSRNFLEGNLKL